MKSDSDLSPRGAPFPPAVRAYRHSWRWLALANATVGQQSRFSKPVIRWMSGKIGSGAGGGMWWFGDFLFDFLTIWIIIDPITALPVFIAVTADCDRATRRRIAGFTALIAL